MMKIALYDENRLKIRDLTYIAAKLKHIDITKFAFEWRILPSVFDEEQKKLASLEVDKMWKNIIEFNNFDGVERCFQI